VIEANTHYCSAEGCFADRSLRVEVMHPVSMNDFYIETFSMTGKPVEIERGCRKTLKLAIFRLSMTCKLLIFNDAQNAIINHLDFFDRLSSIQNLRYIPGLSVPGLNIQAFLSSRRPHDRNIF
jgi:hypothetical protein